MKLQQNTRLALYSLLEFAADPTRHISAAEIARKYEVSSHHLAKVLAELARAGIVQSVRGVGGGYRFAANARRLTLMDVISRFEEFSATDAERTPAGRALASVLSEIDDIAKATMSSITLETMLRLIERQQRAGTDTPGAAAAGKAVRRSA
jgi:Rrf2 family protein